MCDIGCGTRESDNRYYMGKQKCVVIGYGGKKHFVQWLERGKVGNKKEGYKEVYPGETDIVPSRLLRRKKERVKTGTCWYCGQPIYLDQWGCVFQKEDDPERKAHLKCYYEAEEMEIPDIFKS